MSAAPPLLMLPLAAVVGYLVGAVPFGVIAGKLKGVDVRSVGSGKMGSANVTRSLGVRIGLLVMLLDMGKGAAAVLLARVLVGNEVAAVIAGIGAVVGHNWSIFIKFAGGRGVSTGVGGVFALEPIAGIVASVVAFGTMASTRYISLGSMLGASAGAIAVVALVMIDRAPRIDLLYAVVVAPLIIYQHRDNIGRLLHGQERRLGDKTGAQASQGSVGNG